MKKLLLLQALTCTMTISNLHAQSTNGMIAHWPMSGNGNDVSGNSLNGTMNNVTSAVGRDGQANSALFFNGSNSYINVPYKAVMNTLQNESICVVVKPTDYYPGACQGNFILFRGTQNSAGSYGISFFDGPYNGCGVSDTNKYVFAVNAGNAVANVTDWQSNTYVHTQNWYTVVGTYDKTAKTYKVYVNGVLTTTIPNMTSTITNIGDDLGIGKYIAGGSSAPYNFIGVIDDIRVYDRALVDTEIYQYSVFLNPDTAALTACVNGAFDLPFTAEGPFSSTKNSFLVDLSDASGNFSLTPAIGTLKATASGKVSCTIPGSTAPGSGYKLRLRSNSPFDTATLVSLTVVNAVKVTATITAAPGNTVSSGQAVTFSSTITNGGSSPKYQWQKNNTDIAGATNITYSATAGVDFKDNDQISLKVFGTTWCDTTAISNPFIMHVSVGVKDVNLLGNMSIAPNPNTGSFVVTGFAFAKDYTVHITDVAGRNVYTEQGHTNNNKISHELNLAGKLSQGVYLLRILAEGQSKTLRFTVQ